QRICRAAVCSLPQCATIRGLQLSISRDRSCQPGAPDARRRPSRCRSQRRLTKQAQAVLQRACPAAWSLPSVQTHTVLSIPAKVPSGQNVEPTSFRRLAGRRLQRELRERSQFLGTSFHRLRRETPLVLHHLLGATAGKKRRPCVHLQQHARLSEIREFI